MCVCARTPIRWERLMLKEGWLQLEIIWTRGHKSLIRNRLKKEKKNWNGLWITILSAKESNEPCVSWWIVTRIWRIYDYHFAWAVMFWAAILEGVACVSISTAMRTHSEPSSNFSAQFIYLFFTAMMSCNRNHLQT